MKKRSIHRNDFQRETESASVLKTGDGEWTFEGGRNGESLVIPDGFHR